MIGMVKGTTRQMKQVAGLPAPIASFRSNASGVKLDSLKVLVEAVQSGSGTPSPDNVRPITGWSGANVEQWAVYQRCIPTTPQTYSSNGITVTTNANGRIDISGTATSGVNVVININPFTILTETGRKIRFHNNFVSSSTSVIFRNGSTNVDSWTMNTLNRNQTFAQLAGKYIDMLQISIPSGISVNGSLMIDFYDSYNGNTYTIAFGDTYYGCELDVTNGVLRVTKAIYQFDGTETPIAYGSGYRYVVLTGKEGKSYTGSETPQNCLCNMYSFTSRNAISGGATGITLTGDTVIVSTNTPTGIVLVYELATPFTVQLSPQQIAQLAENNIWADTGDVSECKYSDRVVTVLFSKG